jgi:superfamily I DNA/RNA helicase
VVYLAPDLSQQGFFQFMAGENDGRGSVVRQFYVGMTRARQELWFLRAAVNARISGYHPAEA